MGLICAGGPTVGSGTSRYSDPTAEDTDGNARLKMTKGKKMWSGIAEGWWHAGASMDLDLGPHGGIVVL